MLVMIALFDVFICRGFFSSFVRNWIILVQFHFQPLDGINYLIFHLLLNIKGKTKLFLLSDYSY